MPIVRTNVLRGSRVNTDESKAYYDVGKEYAAHNTVNHRYEEYARYTGDPRYIISTNTVEGFYSIFRRGMKGVYQHCSEKHLQRYLRNLISVIHIAWCLASATKLARIRRYKA